MTKRTMGIHHITAIVGHPQETADFYASVLGLRLVKKTVNFDDPGTYHLYFGNENGEPGTIITFFNWAGAYRGKIGDGQVGVTTYSVPIGALSFWESRLQRFNIAIEKTERFGEEYLSFEDPHGLRLEIVEREVGAKNGWSFNGVTEDVAIKGFAGATLFSSKPLETAGLLMSMGFEEVGRDGDFVRFHSEATIGNQIDVRMTPSGRGSIGVGIVHHIAFRAEHDTDQLEWQEFVRDLGYAVTPVQDRNYFNAIYFKEHGEILFEIATDPPGFAIDEDQEKLGEDLKLPSRYEQYREQLESKLIPFTIREMEGKGE